MNRNIKIVLIAIVLLGIIATIVYFIQRPGKEVKEKIAVTPFEKEIESKVQTSIVGPDYNAASTAFYNILDTIATEASIVNQDGSKQLTKDEVKNCKEYAFDAYLPIFNQYQSDYFGRSSWTEKELNALKSRAQNLLDMKIAEGMDKSMLDNIIANVNDYFAAWKVINNAKSCSSIAAVQRIKEQAERYQRQPLTNNASLQAGLSDAFFEAKVSLGQHIIALHGQELIKEQIDRYKEAFGEDLVYENVLKSYDYETTYGYETMVVVNGVNVRLRRTPEINDYNIIATSSGNIHPDNGEYLEYLGETYDFYKIRYRGIEAYISKKYSYTVNVPSTY